jgi:hypothetical protein
MHRRRCRPFTILDAMILVAAVACGLALGRTILGDAGGWPWSIVSLHFARPASYFLLAPTLAFLPIRLRRPRPSRRRLMLQPGMAACCAVAVVTAIDATAWMSYSIGLPPEYGTEMLARFWRLAWGHPGWGVAATWLGLALARRWRPEPGWIDRLGRALGVLWLTTLLCDWPLGRWTMNLTYRLLTPRP